MPPTEASILSNFLLPPASLATIISFRTFVDLFPRTQRSNLEVKHLYTELQRVRALDIDHVKHNIAQEIKRGERRKRQIVKARRRGDQEDRVSVSGRTTKWQDESSGSASILPVPKRQHTLSSLLPEMEQACADIEAEIAKSEAEVRSIQEDMENTIGGLSDLRYGRFSKPMGSENELRDEILDGLKGLENACIARKDGNR